MKEVVEKIEALQKDWADFKKSNDEKIKALETKGHADPLLTEKIEKNNAAMTKLESEIKELKIAANRTARTEATQEAEEKAAHLHQNYKGVRGAEFLFNEGKFNKEKERTYKAAMAKYMVGDIGSLTQAEAQVLNEGKQMIVGNDSQGGYLVRPEVAELVMTVMQEISVMRPFADVRTISSDALEFPTKNGAPGYNWVGEVGAHSETANRNFGLGRIPVHELQAQPKVSQKFLDDASINVEQEVGEEAAEAFALGEGNAFFNGNGVSKPRGFLTYAAGTGLAQIQQVNSGAAADVTFDGIMDLVAALKKVYQPAAMFFLARATLNEVRKLKDSTGQYLWSPALDKNVPAAILGYGYEEAEEMPSVSASSLPIAFGDFKRGYRIVDRMGMRLLRDPYTAKPFVLFDYTKRVGGDVVVHEAIKLQKISV